MDILGEVPKSCPQNFARSLGATINQVPVAILAKEMSVVLVTINATLHLSRRHHSVILRTQYIAVKPEDNYNE